MKGVTLSAALKRIERKAEIMHLDAERYTTARQDAEEIRALAKIAKREANRMQELYEAAKDELLKAKGE